MAHNPNPKVAAANAGLVRRILAYRTAEGVMMERDISAGDGAELRWTGRVNCLPERLDWPMRWKQPKRVFVPSLGDLFHEAVSDEFIAKVFAAMESAPWHKYLLLTKRVERMARMWKSGRQPGSHIWPGVTVCNQAEADAKLPALLSIPAAGHFVSIEPMLGPVDIRRYLGGMLLLDKTEREFGSIFSSPPVLSWVICGGENGPGARPMHPDWARSLVRQCSDAGVPIFVKGMGNRQPTPDDLAIQQIPAALRVPSDGEAAR